MKTDLDNQISKNNNLKKKNYQFQILKEMRK